MLNTVLFDMGGTLEDIWNTQETQAKAMDALQKTLRAHGLEPGCSPEEFDRRVMAGLKEYKRWSEGLELEKKPEEIWPDYYLKEFGFDREKLIPITEELANLWEVTYYHRELRGDVLETLEALKARGYHIGIISNNASLYNVFNMLEEYGIRGCMEDVTVSSVTGYRKPHPEIFGTSRCQPHTSRCQWFVRLPHTRPARGRTLQKSVSLLIEILTVDKMVIVVWRKASPCTRLSASLSRFGTSWRGSRTFLAAIPLSRP